MPNHTMHAQTNFLLVTLSYLIAAISTYIISTYIAIELAGRVKTATNSSKHLWLIAGGSILGLGIWSMHFVAMLEHGTLKDAIYSFPLVFLSVIIAMVGCIFGFYLFTLFLFVFFFASVLLDLQLCKRDLIQATIL